MATIEEVKVKCDCGATTTIADASNISGGGYSDECELCGSHGSAYISLYEKCSGCGKFLDDIEVSSW